MCHTLLLDVTRIWLDFSTFLKIVFWSLYDPAGARGKRKVWSLDSHIDQSSFLKNGS